MGRPKKGDDVVRVKHADVVRGERFKGTKNWTASHWGAYVRGYESGKMLGGRKRGARAVDRLLDRAEVMRLLPLSRAQIDRLERAGKFPQRVRLGDNRVAYSRLELAQWIEARKAERKVRRGGE
jgi:prophage regulatory protein